jgi:hypothetical protein
MGLSSRLVAVQFDKEASQTRDYCVAKNPSASLRAGCDAVRADPSLRKKRLFRMTTKLRPAYIH